MIKALQLKHEMANLRLSPTLEVKFAGAGNAGAIEGYASAFGGDPDSYGHIVERGAFARTLTEHKAAGTMPAMLWCHKMDQPIGRWLEMYEDDYGLFVKGQLNLDSIHGKDANAHITHGDATGFSIGFYTSANGAKTSANGTVTLVDIDLVEVSAVVFPANRRARVTSQKTLQSKSELIDLLRDNGLPRAAATRIAAGGWGALAGLELNTASAFLDDIDRAIKQIKDL